MPSIVTHNLFANEVFESLPNEIQKKINKPIYIIFAQSFDNFFYYNFLTPYKGKEIRRLGNFAQRNNTDTYFLNIISYMIEKHLENNTDILAYLYGSICHYVLDYKCHPYVFYYTGDPKIDKKYRGLHGKMEVNIDAYMLKEKKQKDLAKEKLADELLPKVKFSNTLLTTLDYVFQKTYNVNNCGKIYNQSVLTGNFLIKYFVTDITGCKKFIYGIKDTLMPMSSHKYKDLSFHVTKIDEEYHNNHHDIWFNPWNEESSTASFIDLYEESIKIAVNIINSIEKFFLNQIDKEELMSLINDFSYITGMSWKKELKPKKFKF